MSNNYCKMYSVSTYTKGNISYSCLEITPPPTQNWLPFKQQKAGKNMERNEPLFTAGGDAN